MFLSDGHRIAYEVHGTGTPVLMLHGITVSFAGNFGAWGWIQTLTSAGLQVIGMDLRGHGRSDKPHDVAAYGTRNLATDALRLLDHLGIERASLLGYSLGSAIALQLLHQAPIRVGPSVLIATGDGLLGHPPLTIAGNASRLAEALARPEFPAELPSHVSAYWTFAVKVGGDRLAARAAALADYPPCSLDEARRIESPVLVISGERDPVLGRGPRLAQAIPRGEYLELPGVDHFMLSQDRAAQAAAARFLAGATGAPQRDDTPGAHRRSAPG